MIKKSTRNYLVVQSRESLDSQQFGLDFWWYSLDFQRRGLDSGLELGQFGKMKKRGTKAYSCPRPRTKVNAMSREAISEKKRFEVNRHLPDLFM